MALGVIVMELDIFRGQLQGAEMGLGGFLVPAQLFQADPEIVMGLGIVGVLFDSLTADHFRQIISTRGHVNHRKVVVSHHIGPYLDNAFDGGLRLVIGLHPQKRPAQIDHDLRNLRLGGKNSAIDLHRLLRPAQILQRQTQIVLCLQIVGLELQGALEAGQ